MIFRRRQELEAEPGGAELPGQLPAELPAEYPAEYPAGPPAAEPLAESFAAAPVFPEPSETFEPATAPPESESVPADLVAEVSRLREERTALIALCLYARDRVGSTAAADRIDARLAEIGVATVRPDGEAFDPARHEASASLPTDDPALHNTVAETELPGYSDRGEAVRPPVVSVYQQQQDRREQQ
ncbi:MAG TPA: nucleotide exchange factor GrpE [Mycobacteriales bacterium]|jgi:hypothetical protein|nr:nucleotide exchange factor GrpE [Mycobacteriales bacterium]